MGWLRGKHCSVANRKHSPKTALQALLLRASACPHQADRATDWHGWGFCLSKQSLVPFEGKPKRGLFKQLRQKHVESTCWADPERVWVQIWPEKCSVANKCVRRCGWFQRETKGKPIFAGGWFPLAFKQQKTMYFFGFMD